MRRALSVGVLVCVAVLGLRLALRAAESVPEDGIAVSPSTLVMGSQGVWVTVHADVPYRVVDCASVTLNGIPVKAAFADNQGDLVAKFEIDLVKAQLQTGCLSTCIARASVVRKGFVSASGVPIARSRHTLHREAKHCG